MRHYFTLAWFKVKPLIIFKSPSNTFEVSIWSGISDFHACWSPIAVQVIVSHVIIARRSDWMPWSYPIFHNKQNYLTRMISSKCYGSDFMSYWKKPSKWFLTVCNRILLDALSIAMRQNLRESYYTMKYFHDFYASGAWFLLSERSSEG